MDFRGRRMWSEAIRRIRAFKTISNIAQIFATEISENTLLQARRYVTKRAYDVHKQTIYVVSHKGDQVKPREEDKINFNSIAYCIIHVFLYAYQEKTAINKRIR